MAGYKISEVDVWTADIPNRSGTLSRLLETMSNTGGLMEFMIARPVDDISSRVFLAPISGARKKQAAQRAGLSTAPKLHSIRVEGPDTPGLGTRITKAIAEEGINLRGVSAAGVGKRAVFYISLDNPDSVKTAKSAIKKSLSAKARPKKSKSTARSKGKAARPKAKKRRKA